MEINIGSLLTKRTYLNPDNEALYDVSADRRFSYEQLNERTNQVAHAMLSLGVKKGDRIALLMMNSHEYLTTFLRLQKLVVSWPLSIGALSPMNLSSF